MPERKEIRRQARRSLKKHYWFFVALCLLAAILGTEYADTLQAFQLQKRVEERRGGTDPAPGIGRMSGEMSVFNDLVNETAPKLMQADGSRRVSPRYHGRAARAVSVSSMLWSIMGEAARSTGRIWRILR